MLFGIDEVTASLLQTGFRKPVIQLTLADKSDLRSALLDYHCMLKVKAAMDQYAEGLQQLRVLDLLQKFPLLAKPFFVADSKSVTAGQHVTSVFVITIEQIIWQLGMCILCITILDLCFFQCR